MPLAFELAVSGYNSKHMPRIRNFGEAHKALEAYIPAINTFERAYTLDRMRHILSELGNPQDKYKSIHVAGTSGKTSTSYYIASFLKQAGKPAGLTVSPHVDEVNERVQIDLVPLPEKQFCRYLSEFLKILEAKGLQPTYFELITAFAFWVFAEVGIKYAVIEVGMGGLLDGTNVITRKDKLCVITDIGLDHTRVLGSDVAAIAAQKAGIIRPHNIAFSYKQRPRIMSVIREVCMQQQAELHEIIEPAPDLLPAELPLFQRRNWYLAEQVYACIAKREGLPPLETHQLQETLATYIPARMEIIKRGKKTVIMDGAHNTQKMSALMKSLQDRFPDKKMAVLLSLKKEKASKMRLNLQAVTEAASYIITTSFGSKQDYPNHSFKPQQIAEACQSLGYKAVEPVELPEEALKVLLKRPEPLLVITGSFYLMNHVRPMLLKSKGAKT